MWLTKILKPAPFKKEIEDHKEVTHLYRYWRIRTFYSMYFGYALFYFTGKSFTFAMPALKELGYGIGELGLLGTIFSLVYGIHFLLILFECGSEYHMDSIPSKLYHDILIQIIVFDLLISVMIFIPIIIIFRVLIR